MDTPFAAKLAISTPFGLYDAPNGGKRLPCVSVEWHRARMAMAVPCGYNLAEIRCDGWEIGEARCKVVQEAKERKIKYLFFLDWDVLIPATTLVRLVYLAENNPEFDVVSGIYCLKQDPPEVLLWRGEWGNGISWDWTLGDMITDCVGVGTGVMLIRMSVFDKLDPSIPYFKTSVEQHENEDGSYTRKEMTDDIWFCKRVIEEAKSKILVDTGILCGHVDNNTGTVYTLPDDCLPIRRYNIAKANADAKQWLGNGASVLKELANEVVAKEPERPKTIVEIGSFVGVTTQILAETISGHGVVHAVDTWQGSTSDFTAGLCNSTNSGDMVYKSFETNLSQHLGTTVIPHRVSSVEAAKQFSEQGIQADMVFIDADHAKCAEDIQAWLPLVKPGGIICGHDYSSDFPQVIRDVDEAFGSTASHKERIWIKRLTESAA